MNPIIIYSAIIIVGVWIAKFLLEKIFDFVGDSLKGLSRGLGKLAIFTGLGLIGLCYFKPEQASQLYTKLQETVRNLF